MSIEGIPLGMIEESGNPGTQARTPEEQAMLSRLIHLYEVAVSDKSRWTKHWKTNYRFYMGQQWGTRPEWKSSPIENHVFSKIETMVPILTDNRPKIDTLPRQPEYMEYAETIQKLMNYLWTRNNMDQVLASVVKDMLLFGKGFFYAYWDEDAGEVKIEAVAPQNIFPDPRATSVKDARYMIHVLQMSRTDVAMRWPDSNGLMRRGAMTVPDPGDFRRIVADNQRSPIHSGYQYPEDAGGTLETVVPWVKADLDSGAQEDETVQVVQFWIRDPEVIETNLRDGEGNTLFENGQPIMVRQPKYPGGRHIIVVGDRVVHDDVNPFVHGRFPYVELNCHAINGEFWPVSAAQNLISLQMYLNKINGQILDNAKLVGDGIWIVSKDSNITAEQIVAKPGLVVETTHPNARVDRIPGTPLPNYIPQHGDTIRQALDNVSGVFDVTQGRKPGGITAGVAIEQLQEAAQTRLRLLVRNLEDSIRELGEQELALAQQFYEDARVIRVMDTATQQPQFVVVTPEMIQADWEIEVAAGSTLPRSREARQREAVQLFELGAFDLEALLEHIDHPGRDKLLERLQIQRQLQQALMVQTGGQAPAGPVNPQGGGQPNAQG